MSVARLVDHSVHLANGATVNVAEMAAAHIFVAELPRIAVRVAAFGRGTPAGRRPKWLAQACAFEYVSSTRKGLIRFRAPKLGSVAPRVFSGQQDLFNDSISPDETAFSLLEKGLCDVVGEVAESDRYDDVLLNRFALLGGRAFHAGIRRLTLDGAGPRHPLVLEAGALDRARHLLDRTPPTQRVRVAGRITLLRSHGNAFEVTAPEGGVARCALVGASVEAIKDKFMTDVAVTGTAVFRPSGALRRIDVDLVQRGTEGDSLFRRLPTASAPIAAALPKHKAKPGGSWLAEIVGTWPGPETEGELLQALRESR